MEIGKRIRQWRYDHYITQQEFADAIGYSLCAVQKWENGSREPGSSALIAMSRAMGVSADWLLGLVGNEGRSSDGCFL